MQYCITNQGTKVATMSAVSYLYIALAILSAVNAWQPDHILRISEKTIYSDCTPRRSAVVNGKPVGGTMLHWGDDNRNCPRAAAALQGRRTYMGPGVQRYAVAEYYDTLARIHAVPVAFQRRHAAGERVADPARPFLRLRVSAGARRPWSETLDD